MDLTWLLLPSDSCSFTEITRRQCIAIGWPELGSLEKYIKDKPNWERQFKSYIQIRGDVVYAKDQAWHESDRHFDQIPSIFWQMLHIKRGDLVVAVESGNELTFGRPVIRGVSRANKDAISSYYYDSQCHHAHTVCPGTKWIPWDRFTMGELQLPQQSFRTLCQDNGQIDIALAGWQKGADQLIAKRKS